MRIIAQRKTFYLISGSAILLSCLAIFFLPKNLGIDMTGGVQIEYSTESSITESTLASVREAIMADYLFESEKVLSDVSIYPVNTGSLRADIGLKSESDVAKAERRITDIRTQAPLFFARQGIEVAETQFVSVGQSFGKFVLDRAYLTLTICCIGIALYVMFAFRTSIQGTSSSVFGFVTLATLAHDIVVASGIYLVLSMFFPVLKIDTFFVTAILTILGYSINDTIVILDRIRAEYRIRTSSDQRTDMQIFEDSVQVSFWRSIITSSTLVLVLIAMLVFGPEALYGFVTLMLLGAIVGTYSSIMIAAPLVYDIRNSHK